MELKRYVMLENKEIKDTKNTEYYIWEDNKLCSGSGGVLGEAIKTSDSILDFVENMDLIGCKVNNPFINNQVIYMVIDNPLFLSDLVFFLVNGDKVWFRDSQYDDEEKYADIKRNGIEIISIYKLQPNGDYKKYEVKK